MSPGRHRHCCYALTCNEGRVRSYVGYTVDPAHRLRQHNGEIKGGARRTRRGHWSFLFVVEIASEEWTKGHALSLEWHLKGFRAKRIQKRRWDTGGPAATVARRIDILKSALAHPKFRPFLKDVIVWSRDGAVTNDIWVAIDELCDELRLSPLETPCVFPLSFVL